MICRAIPYEGREPYIFFSYSHKDSERVYPLLEQMVRDGYRVWYDDGNHPGDDWLENIGQHLNNCHLCLAMMSQNSEESHNCKKEVSFAVQCNKKLMAVMLEQFAMTIGMRLQLSTIHYLVKTEYPSDQALLEKLYETDSMRDCRGTPGSLPMRVISEEAPKEPDVPQNTNVLQSFVNSNIPSQSVEKAVAVSSDCSHQPVKDKAKVKTAKVKAKIKLAKKPVETAQKMESDPIKPASNLPSAEVAAELPVHTTESIQQEAKTVKEEPQLGTPAEESPVKEAAPPVETVSKPSAEDAASVQKSSGCGKILLLRLADGTGYISDKDFVRVGRSDKRCDLVLKNNHLISNHHVNIMLENGVCFLQDAGSSNGTFLNGERLQTNYKTQIGNAVKFQICKEDFMLFHGVEVEGCMERRTIAYLRNPATESVRILSGEPFPLDRQHKWEDGSLSNGNISRKHAQICCDSEGYYLEDLGSKNGTYCNDQRLGSKSRCRLTSGDKIRLVDTVLEINIVTF